jgi:drug/metabolite transporter (DMT)-like permease
MYFCRAFGQSLFVAFTFNEFEILDLKDTLGVMSIGILFGSGALLLAIALHTEEAGIVSLICTSDVVFAFIFQFIFLGDVPDIFR